MPYRAKTATNTWTTCNDNPAVCKLTITRRSGKQYTCLIDTHLMPELSKRTWRIHGRIDQYAYVVSGAWKYDTFVFLHRVINDTPEDQECYFRNNDSLDCRRANLVNADHHAVMLNKRSMKTGIGPKSGHKYIKFDPRYGVWETRAYIDKRNVYVGRFNLLTEAVQAQADYYDQHAAKSVEA